jgi:enoyl-CoA hydratase/carnithine racemase
MMKASPLQLLLKKSCNSFGRLRGLNKSRFLSASSGNDVLLQDVDQGVLTLTLNRPQQRNALNKPLLKALQTTLNGLHYTDIRAVVIQGSGPVFCSGHDLRELQAMDKEAHQDLFELCGSVMQLLQTIPQPTIAAVHGMATAGGCQLVAASDIAIAGERAKFCTPGVNLGLFCSTPAVPLVRCIGSKRAMDMLLTGRVISANEALDYGLVSRIVAAENTDGDKDMAVQREAQILAKSIASKSACAMRIGKRTLYQQQAALSLDEAYRIASRAMVENLETEDARHGIQSFLEGQRPVWKHK